MAPSARTYNPFSFHFVDLLFVAKFFKIAIRNAEDPQSSFPQAPEDLFKSNGWGMVLSQHSWGRRCIKLAQILWGEGVRGKIALR